VTAPLVAGPTSGAPVGRIPLAPVLIVYTLLRIGLVAVLTAILTFFMPFIVALLFAVIVQLPLAWMLFAGQRRKLNQAIAARTADRRAERDRLRQALSGE
jgi:hypothetical protein